MNLSEKVVWKIKVAFIMNIRISLDGAFTEGEFSNDKTFTMQFVFRTNAEGPFSDTFFFVRTREGSLAILRRFAEYPIGELPEFKRIARHKNEGERIARFIETGARNPPEITSAASGRAISSNNKIFE